MAGEKKGEGTQGGSSGGKRASFIGGGGILKRQTWTKKGAERH